MDGILIRSDLHYRLRSVLRDWSGGKRVTPRGRLRPVDRFVRDEEGPLPESEVGSGEDPLLPLEYVRFGSRVRGLHLY